MGICLSFFTIGAEAKTFCRGAGSIVFDSKWETFEYLKDNNGQAVGTLLCGYDTDWINEDYVDCSAITYRYSQASLKKGTDQNHIYGQKVKQKQVSSVRVRHTANAVNYYVHLYNG